MVAIGMRGVGGRVGIKIHKISVDSTQRTQ